MVISNTAALVIRLLLTSPLHGLLSRRLMLLTYDDGGSGGHMSVATDYFNWGPGTVIAMSSQLTWLPSLLAGPTVQLRIRGREHDAVPTVVEDRSAITDILAEFANRKGPHAARMIGLPGERAPTPAELNVASLNNRLVVFRLLT